MPVSSALQPACNAAAMCSSVLALPQCDASPPDEDEQPDEDDQEEEEEGDERERDPDVTWQKEPPTRSVVQQPAQDKLSVPFGEE